MLAANICVYTTYDQDADPVCVCTFNSVPADMPIESMPSRHKEIVQQTDWQYVGAEKSDLRFCILDKKQNSVTEYHNNYLSVFINSIFHPPCFT